MGTRIKPAFKSEFPLASEGWHVFRISECRIDTISPEDREKKDGIENDRNFVVISLVEGGEDDGVQVNDFFPNYSKKEFGLSRLAGLMIKTEAIPFTDEIDVETMRTEKFETKFKMSLPKRLFGGRVKHTKSTKKDSEAVFGNIVEYATVSEANKIIADLRDRGKGEHAKGSESTSRPDVSQKEAPKDPWA